MGRWLVREVLLYIHLAMIHLSEPDIREWIIRYLIIFNIIHEDQLMDW